jgi:hypothetical protein
MKMNNIDKKYIIDGITIDKTKDGYRVFTIPTQHFNISNLDELTNDRIEEAIKFKNEREDLENQLLKLMYENE